MATNLSDILANLPVERREHIAARASGLATLKDLRLAVQQTQEQLAKTLGVRQDTISRLEQRSDMLLSTLRKYVESMGGTLELKVQFPDRPPMTIEHLGKVTRDKRHHAH
ncbi:helix-turn-helix transcriptional regulator [Acidithiobacillus ferrooxidans]|uniref:XRE family transcriptional regulator n=1 Tax=Acidithiobacillus ferrooxidans TaxID=920 RepID=UPI001C064EF9|nr:XRE family transcriptional regulator [Acidithiobacillus ferrooxidans]MBU2774464.1 helix-turn-helix transcriptional regulator [Acidithiobacillus ferrooxidans]